MSEKPKTGKYENIIKKRDIWDMGDWKVTVTLEEDSPKVYMEIENIHTGIHVGHLSFLKGSAKEFGEMFIEFSDAIPEANKEHSDDTANRDD